MTETKSIQAGERTQHTPGPWRAVGTGILQGSKDDPEVVATTETGDIMNIQRTEECEANARLIAAAPKMAELIRSLYDHPAITRALNADIIREMQDCLTEAGLIK